MSEQKTLIMLNTFVNTAHCLHYIYDIVILVMK